MPLYSSGEEEESDGENGSAANDDDEDIEEDANGPEETPADFTKPLVDEEEEVESKFTLVRLLVHLFLTNFTLSR